MFDVDERLRESISVNTVSTPRVEAFYWAAITFSQTLGTALGDWMADTGGLGYETALALAGAGATVVLTGRNEAKGRHALQAIRGQFPNADIVYENLDLANLASVVFWRPDCRRPRRTDRASPGRRISRRTGRCPQT